MRISRRKFYEAVKYTPRPAQQLLEDAYRKGHRYLAFFAFPRAGKSFGAAHFVAPMLLEPGKHVWIVAPTYQLGSKEFGYVHDLLLTTGHLRQATTRNFDIRGGNMRIRFPWGSFIEVISADNQTSLRAEELDALILAEASELPPDIFERHLFARVEKRKGIVLVPTTPHGYNWVYHKFRLPSLRDGHKDLAGQHNDAYDPLFWSVVVSADPELGDVYEPGVYDAEYIARAKRLLPPQFYKEQVGGSFASYAGLIYKYEPTVHRCKPFPIPDWWTHFVGWDHGANAPTAIICGSVSPDRHVYLWGEIYTTGKSVAEYAGLMQVMMGSKSRSVLGIDPSAKQVRIELAKLGVCTNSPKEKQIEARIIRITELLTLNKLSVFEGRCPNWEREATTWEWDEENPGKPRERQSCHALDGTGYALLCDPQPPYEEPPDPDVFAGESPEVTALWRGFRKRIREDEEEREASRLENALEEDPFRDTQMVEDYDPEAA